MLISAVLQEIIDESVIDLSTTQMLPYLKSALRQIASAVKTRGFLTEGTLSLSALGQSVSLQSLSSGFIQERNVWVVLNSGREEIKKPQSSSYFHSIYTTNGSGRPEYCLIQGTTMRFNRPSDQAYTIGIEYFKEISDVALSDTFLGDERLIQCAKHLCKAQYYHSYEEDAQKSAIDKSDGLMILERLKQDYDESNISGGVEITEVEGA